ncbi:MAG: aminotransferase class IV family protein [Bacteroidetes bacterium]|nr:aminotransferase class IV family protein [Bacteroidota bacterium]
MCLLLETIRIENSTIRNLEYHNKRLNHSRKELFNCNDRINLAEIITSEVATKKERNLFKCRITYAKQIEKIEFMPYQMPAISLLKLVFDDQLDYAYKFSDRSCLNELFEKRGNCDDILIVKRGLITDTSYANVLFFNGKEWLTPTHPLLRGTQRASLLNRELVRVADIRPEDLKHFEKARIINAMIRFEDALDINILNIHS